ncbi:ninjurin-2-like [Procambarus clarkii]|uniref:ninjurin-2 n=1 Tax=Procambarus clarkii TaxID=6728 RepID=UPI001E677928|nr:ninjurin-1-like [Procambarus clarkii]XP_045594791.1 ninjurin-1-like [Procambarus clarkii]XP_045594792.1 ninjurin-1-like [Procambarus clarkii]XP_045594793.1 ninjurin-1-like [Procambarus clarkii]XP_045594794.1 ninjurin-1-like [Procambarus clarkii]XP_045594795.1 ninjurin-1-like [Procambarus clarkii]
MPRDLRRRGKMELAPLADLRETDAEDVGNGNANPTHKPESDTGIDDGFGTSPSQPPTTVPRRSPFPHSPSPVPGSHGYIPVATDFPTNIKPGKKPLDVNLYATKKTVAQGMMDLALLTANANQLRYVLEAGKFGNLGPNYYISITFISLSIVMQLVIGVALIFMGRYNVSHEAHAQKADALNNWIVLGVFIITVINVFISAFAIEPTEGYDPVLLKAAMITESPAAEVIGN